MSRDEDIARMTSIGRWVARVEADMRRETAIAYVDALHCLDRLSGLIDGLRCDLEDKLNEMTHNEMGDQQ